MQLTGLLCNLVSLKTLNYYANIRNLLVVLLNKLFFLLMKNEFKKYTSCISFVLPDFYIK